MTRTYSAEIAERMVKDCLRLNPTFTVDDLKLECWPDGSMSLAIRTVGEKWLDWLSDNHGWGNA